MFSYPRNYSSLIRVPLPSDREIGRMRSLGMKIGTNLNVARMFAGTGDMFKPTVGLIRAIFKTRGVDAQTREMICLRCAKLLNAPYEWQANVKMASNSGLSFKEINALAADGPVVGLSDDQELVCRATDELTLDATLTDETLAALLNRYGSECTRKIIMTISWFNLLSRFLNACRVPLETEDKIGSRTSPF